jgi:hypothetical protein
MRSDCLQGISDARDKELAQAEDRNCLKSAISTADYWGRAKKKVPATGTAQFGPYTVQWVDEDCDYTGIEVVKNDTRMHLVFAS